VAVDERHALEQRPRAHERCVFGAERRGWCAADEGHGSSEDGRFHVGASEGAIIGRIRSESWIDIAAAADENP